MKGLNLTKLKEGMNLYHLESEATALFLVEEDICVLCAISRKDLKKALRNFTSKYK